jgi:hypothetical protein
MKRKFSTSDTRNLFLRADRCIHQTLGLFRETRDWFDSYTQIDAWRQRQLNIIKQLEKEIDAGLSERGRKRDIKIIRDRMEDSPTFQLLSCEAWATIAPKEREKRYPLRIIYLFWLLHRRLFGVSKYETYPFRDIWGNPDKPEYEDEVARSAIFDTNPENYKFVEESLDNIGLEMKPTKKKGRSVDQKRLKVLAKIRKHDFEGTEPPRHKWAYFVDKYKFPYDGEKTIRGKLLRACIKRCNPNLFQTINDW